MKKKTKQKIRFAIFITIFHLGIIAWLMSGIMTASTLNWGGNYGSYNKCNLGNYDRNYNN